MIEQQATQAASEGYEGEVASHLLAHLLDPQRHTITGLLETLGREAVDWSRAYRLYRDHLEQADLFAPILEGVLSLLPTDQPLVVAVDDTYFSKTGKKMAATGWYKDPLGPPFHTNLIRAQRFLLLSAAIPNPHEPKRAWMIPIAVCLIPKLPKPGSDAQPEEIQQYEQLKNLNRPGAHAARILHALRKQVDENGQPHRTLVACGDGDYTNASLLGHLPERTLYIGRSRGDLSLWTPAAPVTTGTKAGRPASYGDALPKPDELRRDRSKPWEAVRIGETTAHYKRMTPVKWAKAGEKAVLQLIVVKPMRYQSRKAGPWKYTKPAYLLCTDPDLPIELLLAYYFWRWGIEVNHKEIKQLLGAGQAQVRILPSVESAPALCIASYSALMLAGLQFYGTERKPRGWLAPKWYPSKETRRMTFSDLLHQFHLETMRTGAGYFSPLAFNPFGTRARRNSSDRSEVNRNQKVA